MTRKAKTKTRPALVQSPAQSLAAMLQTMRPANSQAVHWFAADWLEPLGGKYDKAGNYIVRVGKSRVLWSCHTDTVHKVGGRQRVVLNGDTFKLAQGETSNCLGADCSTGVWLMREMVLARVPGLYIFHASEEIGGIGSDYIANENPGQLKGVSFAIAFDRKGHDNLITHQGGRRCCSDAFARSLAAQLPGRYVLDDSGSFTDTANYTGPGLVGECTNISVGYYNQHSASETQSLSHALALRAALLRFDESALVAERKPGEQDETFFDRWAYGGRYTWRAPMRDFYESERFRSLADYVAAYPDEIADFLEGYGLDLAAVREALEGVYK
jgi:hypothetical protein